MPDARRIDKEIILKDLAELSRLWGRMSLLLAIHAVPCLLVGISWWIQFSDRRKLPHWRAAVFATALVANAVSSVALLAFIFQAIWAVDAPRWMAVHQNTVASMMGIGLLSAAIASFGSGVSRGLLVGNGVLVAIFWWLAVAVGI